MFEGHISVWCNSAGNAAVEFGKIKGVFIGQVKSKVSIFTSSKRLAKREKLLKIFTPREEGILMNEKEYSNQLNLTYSVYRWWWGRDA